MLGLVLLYWIGKYFYKLAEKYEKSKWGYAFLGIVIYYGGALFIGFVIGFTVEMISPGFFENVNDRLLDLMVLPFGLLSCYIAYKYFERNWKKSIPESIESIGENESIKEVD